MRLLPWTPSRLLAAVAAASLLASACSDDVASDADPPDEVVATGSTTEPPTTDAPTTSEPPAEPAPVVPVAIAGTGTDVDINDVADQFPPRLAQADIPDRVGDLELFGTKAVTLSDGRSIVRGRWTQDEPVETSFSMRSSEDFPEPTVRTEQPIRLFLVDWDAETVVAVSPFTAALTTETAIGIFTGYEIPLEWEVTDDETMVRFTTGFNGAAYDIAHTLWETPLPPA
ncbi:MAG: hypothetical protein DHS20C19_13660 [Acidimicrobiales bacterium]|nr:MAG: hypothetical protein DHS20C19_13660 [Acidimicrobiales bacterium]